MKTKFLALMLTLAAGLPMAAQVTLNGSKLNINGNTVIPSTTTGSHGAGVDVQFSDGSGSPGHTAVFNSDGSVTDGGMFACTTPVDHSTDGLRVADTPYQNMSGGTLYVGGSMFTDGASSTGNVAILIATTSSAVSTSTIIPWANEATATITNGDAGFFVGIQPGYWYYVRTQGAVNLTVHHWIEWSCNGFGGGGGGAGVSSINGGTGAFTFTGPGVSCSGTTCTFSGTSGGVSTVTASGGLASSGGTTPNIAPDSTHVIPGNTGSSSQYLNAAGGYSTPAGTGVASVAGTNGIATTTVSGAVTVDGSGLVAKLPTGPQNVAQPAGTSLKPNTLSTDNAAILPVIPSALASYNLLEQTGTTLYDYSGNTNNITLSGSIPTWSGYGLKFSPGSPYSGTITPQYINFPASLNAGKTFFFDVLTYMGIATSGATDGNSPWTTFSTIMAGNTTAGTLFIASAASVNEVNQPGLRPVAFDGSTWQTYAADTATGHHVLAISCGTPIRFFLDGTEVNYDAPYGAQSGSYTCTTATNWVVGGAPGNPTPTDNAFQGDINFIGVSSAVLTPAQIAATSQQIFNYVAVRPAFPIYIPQTIRQDQVIFVGDSIQAGYSAGGTTIMGYTAFNNTYIKTNLGIGQMTMQSMRQTFEQRILPQFSTGARNIVIVEGCVNDLHILLHSPQECWDDAQALAQKIHKAGGLAVLVTPTSSTFQESNRISLAGIERVYWKTGGFDALADAGGNSLVGCLNCYTNATYFTDGLHPTSVGQQVIAAIISDTVNSLDGSQPSAPNYIVSTTTWTDVAQNNYNVWGTTASSTYTLQSCDGRTGIQKTIINAGTGAITLTPVSGQAIVAGATSIPANGYAILTAQVPAGTVSGCQWTTIAAGTSGGSSTIIQVNGTPTTTATPVNLQNGTGNGGIVVTNPSAGNANFDLSKPIAGAGAGFVTGPNSGVTAGDLALFTGTGGQITDGAIAGSNIDLLNTAQTITAAKTFSVAPVITPGLPVVSGGTGDISLLAHAILFGEGTSAVGNSGTGALGTFMVSQGPSADPSWESMSGDCTLAGTGAITCATAANLRGNPNLSVGSLTSGAQFWTSSTTLKNTTSSASQASTDTTITLTSVTGVANGLNLITVGGNEFEMCTGVSGSQLTGCTRGLFSTTAVIHASASAVIFSNFVSAPSLTSLPIEWIVPSGMTYIGATISASNITSGAAGISVVSLMSIFQISSASVTANSNVCTNSSNIFLACTFVNVSGISAESVGTAVASASTIAPTKQVFHITGTSAIATITAPSPMSSTVGGCLTMIADGLWTTTTGGNIISVVTAVIGTPYQACYDGANWYIK